MKRSSIWKAVFGAVCMGGLCAACTTRPEIHITGSVRHADGALLVCQRSVGGMFNSQTFDTLKLQADSTFTLTLPGGEYERVQFYLYGKKNMGSLLAKWQRKVKTRLAKVNHLVPAWKHLAPVWKSVALFKKDSCRR